MADSAAAQLGLVLERLNSDAEAFCFSREMKELHLNLREACTLLFWKMNVEHNVNLNSLFTHLQDLAADVDGLIDEYPELSMAKFGKKAGGINGRLVQLLNLLRGGVDESTALSQVASSRSVKQSSGEDDA